MLEVAVGSSNPVKVDATAIAFRAIWPEIEVEVSGFDVSSGVSAQPLSDAESIQGATTRAKAALSAHSTAAYGVGIEGGMQEINGTWMDTQWVVIINKLGQTGLGQSVRAQVPDSMMKLIHEGIELGDIIDNVFQQSNMKQAGGYINEITRGAINREQQCVGAVVTALAPFANPDLFQK